MTHYIDIKIKKGKIRDNWIMNKIFYDLHLKLVSLKMKRIGVSFPERGVKLGTILRVHGNKNDLKLLNNTWEDRHSIFVNEILAIPEKINKYENISRKNQNMGNAKLKRLIKRNNLSKEEILNYKKKMLSSSLPENFVELKSSSNKNHYKLFFKIVESKEPISGEFDFYGLSKKGTIPIF